jgi:hypothetical protein
MEDCRSIVEKQLRIVRSRFAHPYQMPAAMQSSKNGIFCPIPLMHSTSDAAVSAAGP